MIDYTHFADWCAFHGAPISDEIILSATGRSARTLRRWRAEGLPSWAADAIAAARGLVKVETAKSYEVWRVLKNGNVICPAGDEYTLSELRAARFYKQAMRGYRVRMLALERQVLSIRGESGLHLSIAANDLEFLPSQRR